MGAGRRLPSAARPFRSAPAGSAPCSAGQSRVARGLNIDVPVLVLISGASANGMFWKESMRSTDVVLDVNTIALRALSLGRTVTLERIDGALHDVFLSAPAGPRGRLCPAGPVDQGATC